MADEKSGILLFFVNDKQHSDNSNQGIVYDAFSFAHVLVYETGTCRVKQSAPTMKADPLEFILQQS